jgi:hypothetical protein
MLCVLLYERGRFVPSGAYWMRLQRLENYRRTGGDYALSRSNESN